MESANHPVCTLSSVRGIFAALLHLEKDFHRIALTSHPKSHGIRTFGLGDSI